MADSAALTQTIIAGIAPKSGRRIPLLVWLGLAWIVLMIATALLADVLAPYRFTAYDLRNRLAPPGDLLHPLGTDELGRDVLSRLIVSIRISLLIAFGATLLSAVFGTLMGFL